MGTIDYKISFLQADQLDDMVRQFGYTKTIATVQGSDMFNDSETEALCDYLNERKLLEYRHTGVR